MPTYFGTKLPFPIEEVAGITVEKNRHTLYLILRDGRVFEYLGNKKFILRAETHAIPTEDLDFHIVNNNNYYYIQIEGVCYLYDEKWILKSVQKLPAQLTIYSVDKHNNIYLFNRKYPTQLFSWNESTAIFKEIPTATKIAGIKSSQNRLLEVPTHGIKWARTNDTIVQLHLYKGDTSIFFNEILAKSNIGGAFWESRLNTMLLDQKGLLWVGSEDGLYLVDIQKNHFRSYLQKNEKASYSMRSLMMNAAGDFYACSYSGFYRVNLKTGNYQKIETVTEGIIGTSMLPSINNCLWIGTEDSGVLYYSPDDARWITYKFDARRNPKDLTARDTRSVWTLFEDKQNNRLLAGAFNGLWIIDTDNRCLSAYDQYNEFSSLRTSTVYYIHQKQDDIWIGSSSGLYKMDAKKGIVAHYHKEPQNGKKVLGNVILFIQNADEDALWLGTKGDGLLKFYPKKGVAEQISSQDGLSDNTIYSIFPDKHGCLWLSSNKGVMRYNIKTKQTTIYLPEQGLPHEEFNTSSYFCAPDGRLFMGGLSGFISFHPDDFLVGIEEDIEANTPFWITAFLQFDGETGKVLDKTTQLLSNHRIELGPQDKFFQLKFSLLDYANTKSTRYAYKIDGIHNDWIMIQENFLRIQGLADGHYILRLKAQNASGEWIPLEYTISIKVQPPFYKTFWFISLVLLFGILLFAGFYWVRVRTLKSTQGKLEQKIKERTQELAEDKAIIEKQAEALKSLDIAKTLFFTNVSHELRTPLTLILGPIKGALDEKYGPLTGALRNSLLNAHRNSLQLKRLVDELMDLAKLEDRKLDLKETAVLLLLSLQSTLSPFRVQAALNNIKLLFETDLSPNLCILIDANKLEKIVNNLLSNAFKFTDEGGTILFQVRQIDAQHIEIIVSDTGSGIAKNDLPHIFERFFQSNHPEKQPQGGTGIGLALCKELTELMGGSIQVQSEIGEGTMFKVILPMKISEFDVNTLHFEADHFEIPQLEFESAAADSPTLLIVEDNADMRLFLQEILSPNYQLILAQNGKEAIDLLPQNKDRINLILSDVMMPKMDGFQLLAWLKSDPYWQQIPVILLTAKVEKMDKIKALRIGVDDYLTKPFDQDELELRIRNLILHYEQRKEFSSEDIAFEEVSSTPEETTTTAFDNNWLQEVEEKALAGLKKSAQQFGIVQLAESMLLSERQFRRRLKACTGLTPVEYLKELRLQWARELLESQAYQTVNEIVEAVGMSSASYFSNLYLARFGKRPFELLQSFRK